MQVAFLRVGALGDLLVGTAALKETCERYPGASVVVFGPRLWTEILGPECWPQVAGIVDVVAPGRLKPVYARGPGNTWVKGAQDISVSGILKKTQVFVNTRYESYRYSLAPWWRRIPEVYGSSPASMSWLYTHWAPWLGKDPLFHERDLVLRILEGSKEKPLSWTVEENRKAFSRAIDNGKSLVAKWKGKGLPRLREFREDRLESALHLVPRSYILINPTASRYEKAWPFRAYREFLRELEPEAYRRGLKIKVIGSPSETDWLREVASGSDQIIQPKTIGDLTHIVGGAIALVCNTSSMQFIAASTFTPTVTLMGQAHPEQWGPLGPQDIVVKGGVPEGFVGSIFERDYAAYSAISPDRVHKALNTLLFPVPAP